MDDRLPNQYLDMHRTTRRDLLRLCGAGVMLGGFGSLFGCGQQQSPPWDATWFYRYRVRLEVDGLPYELGNGGMLGRNEETALLPDVRTRTVNLPMPAAAGLPTGEVLVVFPPSWAGAENGLRMRSPDMMTEFPYSADAFPSVFIFDNGAAPTRVEGYIMRAAQIGEGTRVRVLSVENEMVAAHEWQSIAAVLPWYFVAEQAYRVWTEQGDLGAGRFVRERPEAFVQDGTRSPRPALHAWSASLVPVDPGARERPAPSGFAGPYARLGEALVRGEGVTVPLLLEGDLDAGVLRWPDDPRVFVFRPVTETQQAWALTQYPRPPQVRSGEDWPYMQAMERHFSAPPLKGYVFQQRTPPNQNTWITDDSAWYLSIASRSVRLVEHGTAGPVGGPGMHIVRI